MTTYHETLCEDEERDGDSHIDGILPGANTLLPFASALEGGFPFPHPGPRTQSPGPPFLEPVPTVTKETTVVRTSFLTVPVSTSTISHVEHSSTRDSSRRPSACRSATSKPRSLVPSSRSKTSTHASSTVSVEHSSFPVPASSSSSSPTTSIRPTHPSSSLSTSNASTLQATHRKHAIIGGLSGAIAGLAVIGIFLCWCLRRRRRSHSRRRSIDSTSMSSGNAILQEKQALHLPPPSIISPFAPPPIFQPNRSTGSKPLPLPPPPPFLTRPAAAFRSQITGTSTPDSDRARDNHIDGSLIRVATTDRWPRPFAAGESFRESMGPSSLRVMNPDLFASSSSSPNLEESGRAMPQRIYAEAAARLRETLFLQTSRKSSSPKLPPPAHIVPAGDDVDAAATTMTISEEKEEEKKKKKTNPKSNAQSLPLLPRVVANFSRPHLSNSNSSSTTTTTTTISSTPASIIIPIAISRPISPEEEEEENNNAQHEEEQQKSKTPDLSPCAQKSNFLRPPSPTTTKTTTHYLSINPRHSREPLSSSRRTSSYRIPSTVSDPFDLDPLDRRLSSSSTTGTFSFGNDDDVDENVDGRSPVEWTGLRVYEGT